MIYFFVLGRYPGLSVAEIESVLTKTGTKYQRRYVSRESLVIESDQLDLVLLQKTLGGTVKIGSIYAEVGLDDSESEFDMALSSEFLLKHIFTGRTGKMHFGISIYNCTGEQFILDKLTEQLKDFNKIIKKNLEAAGVKSGFVQIKGRMISSVSADKNDLLRKGAEIVFLLTKDSVLIGKTETVQDFEAYSFRDYSRPQRDRQSGILPPKIARMMINLAKMQQHDAFLDPFCGSGTVLQEAIYLGYTNVTGTDVSGKAVKDSTINIDWLFKNLRHLDRDAHHVRIQTADVLQLSKAINPSTIDAIVTEPFLGPTLRRSPTKGQVDNTFATLRHLYLQAFREFAKVMKKDGRVVMIFPAFFVGREIIYFDILKDANLKGFVQIPLLDPKEFTDEAFSLTHRGSIVVGNQQDFVLREILTFRKD
jgi:tRNA G10  N-methylase Trm11